MSYEANAKLGVKGGNLVVFEMPLNSQKYPDLVVLIDDEDAILVGDFTWFPTRTVRTIVTTKVYTFYARRNCFKRDAQGDYRTTELMHTFITGWAYVDHIDGNGLNNQKSNLRESTPRQNALNTRSRGGKSIYKGVYKLAPSKSQAERWQAKVSVKNFFGDTKSQSLGVYTTELEAARVYDLAVVKHHGEYAVLNFPELGQG